MVSELVHKISEGEGLQLDFKFEIDDQKKIARTLVAFANTEGGSLLIGVKDNGKIVGTNPEEEYYMIEGASEAYCKPPVQFDKNVWQEDRFLVLEIVVPKSDQKHKAQDDEGKWRSYVRIDDRTMHGNKILEQVWKLRENGSPKPLEFDPETVAMIEVIKREGPLSLSKLYRKAGISLNRVDRTLAHLVHWGVAAMDITETGTLYSIER